MKRHQGPEREKEKKRERESESESTSGVYLHPLHVPVALPIIGHLSFTSVMDHEIHDGCHSICLLSIE